MGPASHGGLRCGGTVLAAAIAFAALASGASAATTTLGKAGGLKYVRGSETVAAAGASATSARAKASCGQSPWKTTGGGVALAGAVSDTYASLDSDQLHSWFGAAWHVSQPKRTLSSFGICSKSTAISHDVHLASIPQAPPTSYGSASIDCAQGHVIGGGSLATADDTDVFIETTHPRDAAADGDSIPDDGWQTYMTLFDGTGVSALVYGICRKGAIPSYPVAQKTLDANHSLRLKARCPSDHVHVAGGGVYETGSPLTAHVAATRPIDGADRDRIPDDGWSAKVHNGTPTTQQVTVTAICIG
jgi:hypothetical protein